MKKISNTISARCPALVDAGIAITRPRARETYEGAQRTTIMLSAVTRALLFLALFAQQPRAVRSGGIDLEVDLNEEHSDNLRALINGIECGACKAVTREIADTFKAVATKHKQDAGPTNVFGSRYVSLFAQTLTKELTAMCSANGAIHTQWGFSKSGAESIITTSRAFDRFGTNLTKEETSTIQMTVYGLGVFTKDEKNRFHYNGPPGSEVRGSSNFSLLSNTYQRSVLSEACAAVTDSLEFDEYIEKATKNLEDGFDFTAQHVLCLDLDYCKVKQYGKGKEGKKKAIEQTIDDATGQVMYDIEDDEPKYVDPTKSAAFGAKDDAEL